MQITFRLSLSPLMSKAGCFEGMTNEAPYVVRDSQSINASNTRCVGGLECTLRREARYICSSILHRFRASEITCKGYSNQSSTGNIDLRYRGLQGFLHTHRKVSQAVMMCGVSGEGNKVVFRQLINEVGVKLITSGSRMYLSVGHQPCTSFRRMFASQLHTVQG
ncbi:hypothetical protein EDC04DRAFT_2694231 [Pisolithus marmoratus]|nr:hypothetical protein EDC04DRAFT_2694231 [Pisolithus marmoratus]